MKKFYILKGDRRETDMYGNARDIPCIIKIEDKDSDNTREPWESIKRQMPYFSVDYIDDEPNMIEYYELD